MTDPVEGRSLGAESNSPPATGQTAQIARMYDLFNGGKDSREADREAALEAQKQLPTIRAASLRNRAFVRRVATFLAQEGMDQFLDIGTGIPNPPNFHDVVWGINPDATFLYVDNDEEVIRQVQPFVKAAGGKADFLQANIVETGTILDRARERLDLSRPVALSVIAVWHFIKDGYTLPGSAREYQSVEVMRELIEALAPGSLVAISHGTSDLHPGQMAGLQEVYRKLGVPAQFRSYDDILALFGGLPLVEPGLVEVDHWRPELGDPAETVVPVPVYGGVARKE